MDLKQQLKYVILIQIVSTGLLKITWTDSLKLQVVNDSQNMLFESFTLYVLQILLCLLS